jgi:RNase P protein component
MIAEAWVLGDGSGSRARHAERPTHPFSGPWTVPRDRGGDVARLAAVVSRTCAGSAHERNRERRIEMLTRRPRSAKSQIERKKAHVFCRRSLHLLKARKVLLSLFVAALVSARIYEMGMVFIQIASSLQALWSGSSIVTCLDRARRRRCAAKQHATGANPIEPTQRHHDRSRNCEPSQRQRAEERPDLLGLR